MGNLFGKSFHSLASVTLIKFMKQYIESLLDVAVCSSSSSSLYIPHVTF